MKYYAYACRLCNGAGSKRDVTLADKVCSGGNTLTQCSRCGGRGYQQTGRPDTRDPFYGERLPQYDTA